MKNKTYTWAFAGIAVLATAIILIAWTGGPQRQETAANYDQDTIPGKKRARVTRQAGDRDFDRELRAIDQAEEELSEKDWEQVQRDIEEAMKKVDLSKIQLDVENAMADIDFEKIQQQIHESLAKVDFEKINREVKEAMENIDMEKVGREVERSLKDVDWEKMNTAIKASIEKLSKEEMLKAAEEIKKAQQQIDTELRNMEKYHKEEFKKEMQKAQEELKYLKIELDGEKFNFKDVMAKASKSMAKAREELKGYQEMVYAMEADGLLSTNNDYTIEYKNGEISIDGKKQPASVNDKYRKYFKKDNVRIIKEDGEINIRHGKSG
jgi:hypothetical protein